MVRALDLVLDGREFDSWPEVLVLGWVTVFGWTNYLGISPSHQGRLSLLARVGQEMSTIQTALILCGWGVRAGWLIPYVNKRAGGR